jgi:PleD family two-component response regulator
MRAVHGWLVGMTSPELSSTNDHASSVPNSVLDGETRTSPTSGVDELIEDRPPSPFRVVQSLTPPNPLEPNVIESVPRWKHSPQVLVVDDDAVNRTLLCRLLQKFGCLTEVAGDGAAAVKMAKQGNYDLVLMVSSERSLLPLKID